jgi:hypothetical protein
MDQDEVTPAESLVGLRKAVQENTARSHAALEWSVKTYNLVKPVAEEMEASQARAKASEAIANTARTEARWAVGLSIAAVAASFVAAACEAFR